MSRFFAVLGLALLPAWAFAASSAAPAAGTPAAVVDNLHSALIDGLRKPQSCAARRQRLEPVVNQAFDFELIAQKLLRRQWKDLSGAQRERFRAVIADTAVTTYASQFASTSADKATHFELGDSSSEDRVAATLLPASGDAVSFDYTLRKSDDGWKIVNVVAQGVSDLAVRSAQYQAQIARSGIDGLLSEIEQRGQQARATCGSAS